LDDLTGQVNLAESDLEQYRERSAWADRMVKLSYMSAAQAQAEKSKLDSAVENLRSLQAQRTQQIIYNRKQQLTDFTSKRDNARLAYEQAVLQAEANLAKALAEKRRATAEYVQQDEKIHDIAQQRAECRINAPLSIQDGSMVVYFKNESNRFGQTSSQAMIEQGAQVKEGQKMLRIPNLRRMQVNTKVHEAMVARVKGDVRVPTHDMDRVQIALALNPFLSAAAQNQDYFSKIRDQLHKMKIEEYKITAPGQRARIRVDALPDRVFEGHVRFVAQVASQADAFASDTKLYQTLVLIDHEVFPDGHTERLMNEDIKPDMTAEVTITVDTAKEHVLTVPVQTIIGGTEMGATREVFVKTPTGYDRREVKLGLYNEKVVEIREGLTEGDQIVLNPKVLLPPEDRTRTRDEGGKNNKGGKGGDGAKDAFDGNKGGGPKGGGKGKGGPPAVQ
jgi:multidrug efflux pump subunit AcrA (membrane-fusion protein)